MADGRFLPNELLEIILKHSTRNTRNAIRACSTRTKQVVEKLRLKSVGWVLVWYINPAKFIVRVREKTSYPKTIISPFNVTIRHVYSSHEEFEIGLTIILKSIDCIEKLVYYYSTELPLKLINRNDHQKLRLEAIECNGQVENVLSQLEPVYLRKINIAKDEGNCAIYDMPQVILAEHLKIFESCIREDQLLKLNARYIEIGDIQFSLQSFLKKCVDEPTKLPKFKFRGQKVYSELETLYGARADQFNIVLLDTSHPQLKLKLQFIDLFNEVDGCIHFETERLASVLLQPYPTALRTIKSLNICFCDSDCEISVTRKNLFDYVYKFETFEEAQNKLDEILETTDYIDWFLIDIWETEKLEWKPRDKKLIVEELKVIGNHSTTSIYQLLSIIDNFNLKSILIKSEEIDDTILKMPFISHVPDIMVEGIMLREEQLLNMRVENFASTISYCRDQNKLITAKSINQYIKDRLLDVNTVPCCFTFDILSFNESEIFEGINILLKEDVPKSKHLCRVIGDNDSEFVLEVTLFTKTYDDDDDDDTNSKYYSLYGETQQRIEVLQPMNRR